MMSFRRLFPHLLAVVLLGSAHAAATENDPPADLLRGLVESGYAEPFRIGDQEAWLGTFAADAVALHDGLPPMQGHEALRGFFTAVHSMFRIERFELVVDEVRVNGDWAVTRGHFDALFVAQSEQAPAGVAGPRQGKFLLMWERNASGEWKVIYDMGNSTATSPPSADLASGQQAYYSCLSCHGAAAQGNEALGAPALAGMPAAYIERQLMHYRSGSRGQSLEDLQGRQMGLIAATLADDQQVRDVAAYIESLPSAFTEPAQAGSAAAAGAALFHSSCAVCHEAAAGGNADLPAPPLGGQLRSYLSDQLRNYRDGLRGNAVEDVAGRQMAAIAANLDDQQIAVLADFLASKDSSQ